MTIPNVKQSSVSDKVLSNVLKIIEIPINTLIIKQKKYRKNSCPAFSRTFNRRDFEIVTTIWIYNKTPFLRLKNLPKHWQSYMTAVCDVCDILQVWFLHCWATIPCTKNMAQTHLSKMKVALFLWCPSINEKGLGHIKLSW